jgi:hypothetical protein
MIASGMHEDGPSGRHFLIRVAEAQLICTAIRRLASGPLAEATIEALEAACLEAEVSGSGGTAFRFRAPAHAGHLMTLAAIRARGDAGEPFGLHLLVGAGTAFSAR